MIYTPLCQYEYLNIATRIGRLDSLISVVSASRLHWNTTKMFRPFVEVNLIGPGTSGVKRKFTTGTKNKTYSPLFNESFHL